MKYNPVTRRQFLMGSGGAMLSIPLLTSLLPKVAYSQTVSAKRFICLFQDNGRHAEHWYPNMAQDANLRAVPGVEHMREMLMRDLSGNISQVFGASFNGSLRDKLMLIRGLDGLWSDEVLGGHRVSVALSAADNAKDTKGRGPSIDMILRKSLKSNPRAADPKSYLGLGVSPSSDISFNFNPANNQMTEAGREFNPQNAFNSLFGAGVPGASPTPPPVASNRKLKSVDAVIENYRRLIASPKLATAERQLLQDHMDQINDLENSLRSTSPPPVQQAQCAAPSAVGGQANSGDSYSIERALKHHMDIMVAGIKCGIVNVGTIMMNRAVDDTIYRNLGISVQHHGALSHTTMDSPEILKITQWMAGNFHYFINALNVEEPGTNRTYLDNSFVYYANCMGSGFSHSYLDMPVMTAGSLGGRIRSGRYIDYRNMSARNKWWGGNHATFQGRNYSQLLVTIMRGMGLDPVDYLQPNAGGGYGSDNYWYPESVTGYRADRSNPLPGILT